MCGFAFNVIGAHRIEARVQLQNGRANGALRKLGAVQEGILRRSARRRGEYVDQVLWSVLKDDWSDHWVVDVAAGALMDRLPLRARLYVTACHRAGRDPVLQPPLLDPRRSAAALPRPDRCCRRPRRP